MQQAIQPPAQTPAAKPAPARPPLPPIPPEFDAGPILQMDAPKLIQLLKDPAATVFQKAKACHRLAVIGGKDAVPALAALLGHPELSNYARFGLEPNPDPSADAALRAELTRLEGRLLAGVATSLGVRQDAKSITRWRSCSATRTTMSQDPQPLRWGESADWQPSRRSNRLSPRRACRSSRWWLGPASFAPTD